MRVESGECTYLFFSFFSLDLRKGNEEMERFAVFLLLFIAATGHLFWARPGAIERDSVLPTDQRFPKFWVRLRFCFDAELIIPFN